MRGRHINDKMMTGRHVGENLQRQRRRSKAKEEGSSEECRFRPNLSSAR